MGINSHVAWDVRAKKKQKEICAHSEVCKGVAVRVLRSSLAETNSSLLLVSDVNGQHFFEFVGLHTKLEDCSIKWRVKGRGREEKEDHTTLKMRELVSLTSQLADAPSRTRTQENLVTVFAKEK